MTPRSTHAVARRRGLLELREGRFPPSIGQRPDACGLRVLWTTLRHFGRRTTGRRLVRLAGWQAGEGVHAIAMACTLAAFGLTVEFHSDPDPAPRPRELPYYRRARALGIAMRSARSVRRLLPRTGGSPLAILLYDVEGEGHFSILRGVEQGVVVLNDARHPIDAFERMRAAPETYRQSVLVADFDAAR